MLNPKKSKHMQFKKRLENLLPIQLDGKDLDWGESWTYLGVTILSHKDFSFCISKKVINFYRSTNAILC